MRLFCSLFASICVTTVFSLATVASPISATFTLLQDPQFEGLKPSAPAPAAGDWLIGTGDDQSLASDYNPNGALSHSFADLTGSGGAAFNMSPSLSGSLTLEFTRVGGGQWDVSAIGMAYSGRATPFMFMNQFLVAPGSAATQNAAFQVDGLNDKGTWQGAAGDWAINYEADFYVATNADGDVPVDPSDVDVTFSDAPQRGYLIPVSRLTTAGLQEHTIDDPVGFFAGDFKEYLLNTVAPLLPSDATFLLVTQMEKTHPAYAELGLPITTAAFIGNTTVAFTTASLPEPAMLPIAGALAAAFALRRRRGSR